MCDELLASKKRARVICGKSLQNRVGDAGLRDTLLVTGGAGFIGSCFVLQALKEYSCPIVVLDALTYAGSRENLREAGTDPRLQFVHGDICDTGLVGDLIAQVKPRAIIHCAAETHVDRSIVAPDAFIRTNVEGTFRLLQAAHNYYSTLEGKDKENFRFLHLSTDEVYGSLAPTDRPFTEDSPYRPNSPYSASKASSNHLVRAYQNTYGLPTLTVNSSNNYGPRQFPEKLIPRMITNALAGKELPIYGDGQQIRDWIYVEDCCAGIRAVLERGRVGETYNLGGRKEITNIALVRQLCLIMDEIAPKTSSYSEQITYVEDRLGHDRRYALDTSKAHAELDWKARVNFEFGLRKVVTSCI